MTAKVLPAIAAWRQHPTEIEAELADRGHEIGDWHRGVMSSRRLLVLLKHARDDGPYRAALRDGDWPVESLMLKEIHKELALDRASKYVGSDDEYQPKVFVSPAERVELDKPVDDGYDADAFMAGMSAVFADSRGGG